MVNKLSFGKLKVLCLAVPLLLFVLAMPVHAEDTPYTAASTDTAATIQQAIDNGATTVVFPEGSYTIDSAAFTIPAGEVTFQIDGTVNLNGTPSAPVFAAASSDTSLKITGSGKLTLADGTNAVKDGNFTLDGPDLTIIGTDDTAITTTNGEINLISGLLDIHDSALNGSSLISISSMKDITIGSDNVLARMTVRLSTSSASANEYCINISNSTGSTMINPGVIVNNSAKVYFDLRSTSNTEKRNVAVYGNERTLFKIDGGAVYIGSTDRDIETIGFYGKTLTVLVNEGRLITQGLNYAALSENPENEQLNLVIFEDTYVNLFNCPVKTGGAVLLMSGSGYDIQSMNGESRPVFNSGGGTLTEFKLTADRPDIFTLYNPKEKEYYNYKAEPVDGIISLWASPASVTFMDGDTNLADITVIAGTSIATSQKTAEIPADPSKEGCIFAGWYTEDGTLVEDPSAVNVEESLILVAKYTEGAAEKPDSSIDGGQSADGTTAENTDTTANTANDSAAAVSEKKSSPSTGIENGAGLILLTGACAAAAILAVRRKHA